MELSDLEIFWETMRDLMLRGNSGPTSVPRQENKSNFLWHSQVQPLAAVRAGQYPVWMH